MPDAGTALAASRGVSTTHDVKPGAKASTHTADAAATTPAPGKKTLAVAHAHDKPIPRLDLAAKKKEPKPDEPQSGDERFLDASKQTVAGDSTLDIAMTRDKGDGNTHYDLDASSKSLESGDANANTFYCSGLQVWTLGAAGYDMSKPILGADGKPYTYTWITKDKDGKEVTKPHVTVTLHAIIDGYPVAVEAMSVAEKNGMTNGGEIGTFRDPALGGAGHAAGWDDDGKPNRAVRGAAAAFELARIGREIPAGEQKPGDFAQARYKQTAGGKHDGHGHAWQVHSVIAVGAAMFGKPNSPIPVGMETIEGWHEDVVFLIEITTDPKLVGPHVVKNERRLEANVAGAIDHKVADKTVVDDKTKKESKVSDGGVQVTGMRDAAASDDAKHHDVHFFYGRLDTSKWSSWTGIDAKPDAPTALDPDAEGTLT
jgi:hypothetical protein